MVLLMTPTTDPQDENKTNGRDSVMSAMGKRALIARRLAQQLIDRLMIFDGDEPIRAI
jgi:hypothetical protein